MEWVQIRSWHQVLTPTRVPDRYVTLCGRRALGPTVPGMPAGKSCEVCLRNAEWLRESEDDPAVAQVDPTT